MSRLMQIAGTVGLLSLMAVGCHNQAAPQAAPATYVYASFYAEMAGDFADPIDSDAPAHYAWTEGETTVNTANMEDIWRVVGLPENTPSDSQSEIEIRLLNFLDSKGWRLEHFTSYSVPSKREDLQTVYRYIFRKQQ